MLQLLYAVKWLHWFIHGIWRTITRLFGDDRATAMRFGWYSWTAADSPRGPQTHSMITYGWQLPNSSPIGQNRWGNRYYAEYTSISGYGSQGSMATQITYGYVPSSWDKITSLMPHCFWKKQKYHGGKSDYKNLPTTQSSTKYYFTKMLLGSYEIQISYRENDVV